MKNAKSCPTAPLPAPPVNVILPLPLTPSPTKAEFLLGDPENRIPHRRRRSSTFAAIKNWALTVQPGSPVPNSPQNAISVSPSRRSSVSAARDFITRRASVSHHHALPNSSVAHLVQTPKTGGHKQSFDLTDLGYTSVFVRLAHTPTTTPTPFLLRDPFLNSKSSSPKEQQSGLKRVKSLGMFRRNRRTSVTATAPSQQPPSRARSHSRSKSALMATPSKKSAPPPLPPTLASELLLRQFTDGGSLETHAKRVMEEQARAAAPTGSRADAPVGTVYRDENGTLWQDEDEKLEREALLPPRAPESPEKEWITFNSSKNANSSPILPGMAAGVGASAESEERRGSFGSINSSFSLSPNSLVTPADGSPYTGIAPFRTSISGGGPPSPLSWSASLRSPISPTSTVSTTTGMAAASGTAAQNKRTRRRPAPLRLNVPSSPHAFDDSFIPSPRTVALASLAPSVGGRRHSSVSGLALTAPPARIEFLANDRDGDVPMKENVNMNVNDPVGAGITRKGLGMRKISKLNLKSMKALFGGHP